MSLVSRVAPLALLAACLTPVIAFAPGFNYGGQKVRGVNLGGWLVLEVGSPLWRSNDRSSRSLALDHAQLIQKHRQLRDRRRIYLRSIAELGHCGAGSSSTLGFRTLPTSVLADTLT